MKITEHEYKVLKKNLIKSVDGKGIRVCIYCRKSQKDTRENSLDTQLKNNMQFIEEINKDTDLNMYYDIEHDVYSEDDRSGMTLDKRTQFNMMYDFIITHPNYYGACIIYTTNRFQRNIGNFQECRRKMERNGCKLLFLDHRDNGTPESEFLLNIKSSSDQYTAQSYADYAVRGMKNAITKNRTIGPVPYGYEIIGKNNNKKVIIRENEAINIKEIFKMYINGNSINEIIDKLKSHNAKTKNNNDFCTNSIMNILKNERYTGVYIWGAKPTEYENRKCTEEINEYRIEGLLPPIISKAEYQEAKVMIDNRKYTRNYGSEKYRYFLSGKIVCKNCGKYLVGNGHVSGRSKEYNRYYSDINHYKYKTCDLKDINADYIENLICNLLVDIVNKLIEFDSVSIINTKGGKINDISIEIKDLKKKLDKCEDDIKKLVRIQIQNMENSDLYNAEISDRKNNITKLKATINNLEIEYEKLKKITMSKITKYDLINNETLYSQLINLIIDRIEVTNDDIIIYIND